jgi:hypothetical protein
MDNRLDIKFRFRPSASTPDAILLDYLRKQELSLVSHEMILKALRAFWLPDAYHRCGGKKSQELKKLAQNMILVLEEQANYLRTVFGIERQVFYQAPVPMVQELSGKKQQEQEQEEEEEENNVWKSVQRLDTGGL